MLFIYLTILWQSCRIHYELVFSIADIFGKTSHNFTLCLMFPFSPFFFPFLRPLTKTYQEVVRSVFTSSTSSSGASRRQTMKDLQEEFSNLYNNVRLFEKGAKHFTGTLNYTLKNKYGPSRTWNLFQNLHSRSKKSRSSKRKNLEMCLRCLTLTYLMLECIASHTDTGSPYFIPTVCYVFWQGNCGFLSSLPKCLRSFIPCSYCLGGKKSISKLTSFCHLCY